MCATKECTEVADDGRDEVMIPSEQVLPLSMFVSVLVSVSPDCHICSVTNKCTHTHRRPTFSFLLTEKQNLLFLFERLLYGGAVKGGLQIGHGRMESAKKEKSSAN